MSDKNKKALEESVEEYIQHLRDKGHEDRDSKYENYIFEAAVEFIRGSAAFKEINALMEARDEEPR